MLVYVTSTRCIRGWYADSDDLARVFRFDLARGGGRSGCLVSGIGGAAWSILNRGSKDLFFAARAVMGWTPLDGIDVPK
jgi:hypothetical protein